MWQMTVIRIITIILTGAALYWLILVFIDGANCFVLRHKRKTSVNESDLRQRKIVIAYLAALTILIILCVVVTKYYIRGAK